MTERHRALEEMLAVHRPDLRRGEALGPEFDSWDFSTLDHWGYCGVLDERETVQCRVLRGTKFSKMFRHRCADFRYLETEANILAKAEIPAGWGLLVRSGEGLQLDRPPVGLETTAEQSQALLESIARTGTKDAKRGAGVVLAPRRDWTFGEMPER